MEEERDARKMRVKMSRLYMAQVHRLIEPGVLSIYIHRLYLYLLYSTSGLSLAFIAHKFEVSFQMPKKNKK